MGQNNTNTPNPTSTHTPVPTPTPGFNSVDPVPPTPTTPPPAFSGDAPMSNPFSSQNSSSSSTTNNAAFSGDAPMSNPFSGQNSIPSSATNDIVINPNTTTPTTGPSKKILLAIILGGLALIGIIVAVVLLTSPNMPGNNQSTSNTSGGNSSTNQDSQDSVLNERKTAIALYDRMPKFLEEFANTYAQSPEIAESLIDSEVASSINAYDEYAVQLTTSIVHYYRKNSQRLAILYQNNCVKDAKEIPECINSVKQDPNNDTGLTDTEKYLTSIKNEVTNNYNAILAETPNINRSSQNGQK